MGERSSKAAGGGLPLEERRDRRADPACADASRAGAGPGRSKPRRNITAGASPITSRTTAGWTKDRRGGGDVHGSTGLRHGET